MGAAMVGRYAAIKPIETTYRGYRFRSRLEARWAVYFDAMGFPFEYEKEGFTLNDGTRYLPDFWLPQVQMWAEVKPEEFTDEETRKCHLLTIATGFPCLELDGMPDAHCYWATVGLFDNKIGLRDYVLSNHNGYPQSEHRFYSSPVTRAHRFESGEFDDVWIGVNAARAARFEFGR